MEGPLIERDSGVLRILENMKISTYLGMEETVDEVVSWY